MNIELKKLEEKVELLILTNARLRAENHHLRQQLANHLNALPSTVLDEAAVIPPKLDAPVPVKSKSESKKP